MQSLIDKRRLLLATALYSLTPLFAAEPDLLARIGSQFEQYPVVRAEFVQSKQMAAMKRPLLTTGRLVYSRVHGVLWQIEKPFRLSYVLGADKITEIGADGLRRERGLREVPGLAQVGRILRAMLGANTTALREYFDASVQGDLNQWEITLKPRQPQLSQFLTGLRLSGSRFVEGISISEAGGDSTQIRFSHSQGSNALSEAELGIVGSYPAPTSERPLKP